MTAPDPQISIVLPVRNGARHLRRSLPAVFAQAAPPFEVIVVDSGSTDRSLEICRKWPVRIIEIAPRDFNHGATRNLGASQARGEFLVFLVQDAVPADDRWLERLVAPLREQRMLAGTWSHETPFPDQDPRIAEGPAPPGLQIYSRRTVPDVRSLPPWEAHAHYAFCDVSSCMRRSVWERFPFRPLSFSEDTDWNRRILAAGYEVAFVPDSVVHHSHLDRPWLYHFRRGYTDVHSLYAVLELTHRPRLVEAAARIFRTGYGFLRETLRQGLRGSSRALYFAETGAKTVARQIGESLAGLAVMNPERRRWLASIDRLIRRGL